jgi:hypothetical protein
MRVEEEAEAGMDGTMEELRAEKLYARNNSINF